MTKEKDGLITAIVQFPLVAGASIDEVKRGIIEVAPYFRKPAGLLRKYFLLSEDGATAGGVYLWASRQQARDFSETTVRAMIKKRFHVDPSISYFETPVVVENEFGDL